MDVCIINLSNFRLKYLINIHFRHWPLKCAKFIGSKLSKEQLDGVGAWKEIQSVCRKTVEDLKTILGGLEKFLANELEVDQKKRKMFLNFTFLNNNIIMLLYQYIVL